MNRMPVDNLFVEPPMPVQALFKPFQLGALELPTRVVMGLSAFVGQFWWFFIIGVVGLVFGIKQINKHPKGRYYFDYTLLKLPILGVLLRKIAVARFCRSSARSCRSRSTRTRTTSTTGRAASSCTRSPTTSARTS